MPRDWVLEVKTEATAPGPAALQLGLKDPVSGKIVAVSAPCRSLEELQTEIGNMKAELDGLAAEGRKRFQAGLSAFGAPKSIDPQEAWKTMQSLPSEDEMLAYFNAHSQADREAIAEYILTHANMFKGMGAVFSERYDASTHSLE